VADSPAAELPLFPLDAVVLFPGVRAPLHIFELRYRQMMEAALGGARTIGMATVLPEHAADLSGNPPLFEVGCAGFLEAWERLADGRFNLVLHGTQRFRIVRERPPEGERLFRIAEVELLKEEPVARADESELRAARERVQGALAELLARAGREPAEIAPERLAALDAETFTNTLCQLIALPTEEKQGLLQTPGTRQRLDTLDGILQFHLARARLPGGGSEAFH
jgi:Lon protease-like protein